MPTIHRRKLSMDCLRRSPSSGRRASGGSTAIFPLPDRRAWTDVLARHAIIPQQQFAYTTGKNASDITLVIDAMDLLHSGRFDGFCLVSSDSDFTRLAARIREQGVDVFGFGEHKTPESFRQACRRFVYIENLFPTGLEQPGCGLGSEVAATRQRRDAYHQEGHLPDGERRRMGHAWERSASNLRTSLPTSIREPTAFASSAISFARQMRSTSRNRKGGSFRIRRKVAAKALPQRPRTGTKVAT